MQMRSLILSLVFSSMTVSLARQPPRNLPPTDVWPRTKAEWLAEWERPERQAGPFREAYPAYAGEWDRAWARMSAMTEQYNGEGVTFTPELADALLDELYVDNGHPILNSAVQDFTLHVIDVAVRWPVERMPDGVRQRIADGLLDFVRAGGGQGAPHCIAHTATVLDHAGFDDPDAQSEVDRLLNDAFEWAETVDNDVQREAVAGPCEQRWGDVFALRAHEARTKGVVPAEARTPRYERAVTTLTALLADTPRDRVAFVRALRDATQAAQLDLEHAAARDDLTARLLIVYRRLLARRPPIPDRAADYIDDQLLRMAARGEQLVTDRHWRLWAEAVRELQRDRISSRLRSWIRVALEKRDTPAGQRAALGPLAAFLADPAVQLATTRPAP